MKLQKVVSDERRQLMSERWTPEMRAAASSRAKEQYEAWAAEHPDRAAFVIATHGRMESGDLVRPTCPLHGHPAKPVYDWDQMAVVGWRCRSGHQL